MDLSFLRGLYDTRGPWASVYLDATHDSPEALEALKARWKAVWRTLGEAGADDKTRAALQSSVINDGTFRLLDTEVELDQPPHKGRHGLALFAAQGAVQEARILPSAPGSEIADVAAVPHAMPLLLLRGEQVRWLRVIVSRTGADVEDSADHTIEVSASHTDDNIRKTHGGSWSQDHFQRHAESHWLHNAKEMADKIDELATGLSAELLIVAGDVRERQLLIQELPQRWRDRVVESETGSRAAGADLSGLEEFTEQAIANRIEERRKMTMDAFHAGGDEAAANGVREVVDALNQSQVDTLLLNLEKPIVKPLLVGADVAQLGLSEQELVDMGSADIQQARAEDALIRAAVLTDAEVMHIPPDTYHLADGVGAVLRHKRK